MARQLERARRNVQGAYAGGGALNGEGDGDAPAAGAEIKCERRRSAGLFGGLFQELPAEFGEEFGFGPGNEDVAVDGEIEAAKAGGAEDVLQGFALAASAHEFAEGGLLVVGEDALEVQIKLHARDLEQVGEEKLGVQARGLDAFFGEKIDAALDGLQNGHGNTIGFGAEVQRAK